MVPSKTREESNCHWVNLSTFLFNEVQKKIVAKEPKHNVHNQSTMLCLTDNHENICQTYEKTFEQSWKEVDVAK